LNPKLWNRVLDILQLLNPNKFDPLAIFNGGFYSPKILIISLISKSSYLIYSKSEKWN
jgi:hypothetical protein